MPAEKRRHYRTNELEFGPYDLEGSEQPEFGLIPLSYNRATGNGCYLMRMGPDSETIFHVHEGVEDFYVLQGDLIDDDGTIFESGDFVSYEPGSRHNSRSLKGCVLLVCEWGK